MSKEHHSYAWDKARKIRLAIAKANDEPCCRCGQQMNWELHGNHRLGPTIDHLDPLATGGQLTPPLHELGVAHRVCNSRHGASLSNAKQGTGPGSRGGQSGAQAGAPPAKPRRLKIVKPETEYTNPMNKYNDDKSLGPKPHTPRKGGKLLPGKINMQGVMQGDEYPGDGAYSPPRLLSGRHERAVGTFSDEWVPWIEDADDGPHIKLRTWQKVVLERALEYDSDGKLCWRDVVVSTPRQCLDGDTVVFRRDGSACRLRDHEDAWSTGVKPTRRYTARGGASFVATDNHPVMTPHGWVPAGELRPGDLVSVLVGWDVPAQVDVSLDEAAFLGWMVTDGTGSWRTGRKWQSPKFTNVRREYLDEVERLAADLFGIEAKWYVKGNGFDLLLTDRMGRENPANRWLSGQGLDEGFPTEVFRWGRAAVGMFVSRAWAGNGCVRAKSPTEGDVFLAVGNSEVCARYWQMLLARWGVTSTCKPERHNGPDGAVFWRLVLSPGAANLDAFFDLVGEVPGKPRVSGAGNRVYSLPVDSVGVDGERFRWRPLVRVEDAGEREVFDVSYPGKGWFVANCAQVHNSGKGFLLWALAAARCHFAEQFGESQELVHVANNLSAARRIHMRAWRWAAERDIEIRKAFGAERLIWGDGSHWSLCAVPAIWGWSASVALLDECWDIPREVATEAILPTLVERNMPQMWLFSTANSGATPLMGDFRRRALGGAPRVVIAEWSAEPGADVDDPAVWRAASPHWSEQREELIAATPRSARREQWLSMWPDDLRAEAGWLPGWGSCPRVVGPVPSGCVAALEVAADRSCFGVAVAWLDGDGRVCVVSRVAGSLRAALEVLEGWGPSVVLAGASLASQAVGSWVVQPAGLKESRVATPWLADAVRRGLVVHDHDAATAEQFAVSRTATVESGELVSAKRSRGAIPAVKAVMWAAVAAGEEWFGADEAVIW